MICNYPSLADIPPEEIPRVFDLSLEAEAIRVKPGGYNAHVIMIQTKHGNPDVVTKLYGDKKRGFTEEQARIVASHLVHYRILLTDFGIVIPQMCDIAISENSETGIWWVVETEHYSGSDQLAVIRTGALERVEWVVRTMLESSLPFLTTGEPLPIGLDPLPSNFCISEGETVLTYVDFMPVRYVEAGGRALVEWPEPTTELGYKLGFWKHYMAVGLLTVMLTQLCRYRPEFRPHFKRVILEFLQRNRVGRIAEELVSSPGWEIRRTPNLQELEELVAQNVYHARNLACELAFIGQISQEQLSELFRLSHFEDSFTLPKIQSVAAAIAAFL
ncbi:MAG: hypothetical protein WAP74_03430 [Patescibacteria group bacterium]